MAVLVFIGLGHMGKPMASNLLKAGHEVWVYDVNPGSMQALTEVGAKAVTSLSAAIKNAEIIFTMVQTSKQVKEVCLNAEDGIFNHAKPNTLYIDCSSIDIVTTRELHALAKEHQINMLDCPVSGGVAGARGATLTLMVGGSKKDLDRAKNIIQSLGKKIVHVGAEGTVKQQKFAII